MPVDDSKKYRLTLVHFWWSLLIILVPIFLPAGLMVLERVKNKEIGAGNYYDTPTWRILSILLLLSNPILWVSLYAEGLPFDARLVSALLIWFGITSSMAGTVWYNRRLKSSDRSK